MRQLYERGRETGRTGSFWQKNVPTAPLVKAIAAGAARN
jgi:hypothetical protein